MIVDVSTAVTEEALEAAASVISSGRLAVIPTDTVYGLAADAFSAAAVRRLLDTKGRGRDMPPPVLVGSLAALEALVDEVPAWLRAMLTELWPGPLTVICRQQASLSWDLGDTRGTVAVRMPDHEVARAILARTGPLAVSSANRSGQSAATSVAEAVQMLGETVDVYLDAGASPLAVASTILDLTGSSPRVVRDGPVTLEQLHVFNNTIVGT